MNITVGKFTLCAKYPIFRKFPVYTLVTETGETVAVFKVKDADISYHMEYLYLLCNGGPVKCTLYTINKDKQILYIDTHTVITHKNRVQEVRIRFYDRTHTVSVGGKTWK